MLVDPRLKPLKGWPEFAALASSLATTEAGAVTPESLPTPNATNAFRMGILEPAQ
jgi:hypothetical protein